MTGIAVWSHYLEQYVFAAPCSHYGVPADQLLTVAPSTDLPVPVAEVKEYLRIDDAAQDTVLERLVRAATRHAEAETGVHLAPTGLEYRLEHWPHGFPNRIMLPAYPVRSIESVGYLDPDGVLQTVDPAQYELVPTDSGAFLFLEQGFTYPATKRGVYPVRIRFSAGYNVGSTGDDPALALPNHVAVAITMIVAHWFENRGDALQVKIDQALHAAAGILQQLRVYR